MDAMGYNNFHLWPQEPMEKTKFLGPKTIGEV